MNRAQFFDSTVATLDSLIARSEVFLRLPDDQLNIKTGAHDWTIGQIFDHLVKTDEPIGRQLFEQLAKFDKLAEDDGEVRFSFIGKFLIHAMAKPNVPVPGKLIPATHRHNRDVIGRYIVGLQKLKAAREDLQRKAIERIKIQSPAATFVRYNGMDTLGLATSHGERHLAQAEAVLRAMEPPR